MAATQDWNRIEQYVREPDGTLIDFVGTNAEDIANMRRDRALRNHPDAVVDRTYMWED
jgi:hypothetical protein